MIELTDVVKEYRGGRGLRRDRVRALDGVTLHVESGTALGVVGLNGAGKSTLLRVLLGYVRPTEGTARIDRLAPRAYVQRSGIAYVPEDVTVPRAWTVRDALRTFAMLGDLGNDAWERVEDTIRQLGLEAMADRAAGTLSKGNLQRLGIAQALVGDRKLMVLDEPTDGLDPVWTAQLRSIIADWRANDPDRILVLASHHLTEVERLTDRVLILHNGKFAGELATGGEPGTLEASFLDRVAQLEEARA